METLTLKKEAIDIINGLPESKVQTVVQFAQFISTYDDLKQNFPEEEKKRILASLNGSVQDDSFVRPSQPLFSDDAERKAL